MEPVDLDIKELRCFIALVEELNFARAAKRMGMSQPAFSRHIMKLEGRMNVRLLERTTRQVLTTRAGEHFEQCCRSILSDIASAYEETRRIASGTVGNLRIGFTEFAIAGPLPEIIRRFREANSEIQVDLSRGGTLPLLASLEARKLDIAFTLPSKVDAKLRGTEAWEEPLIVIMHKDDPLAKHRRISPKMLDQIPMVMGIRAKWLAFRKSVQAIFANRNVRLNIATEAEDTSSILGLVEAGMGPTIYTAGVKRQLSSNLVARPLDVEPLPENLSRTMVHWHSEFDGDEALERLLSIIETVAGHKKVAASYHGEVAFADPRRN